MSTTINGSPVNFKQLVKPDAPLRSIREVIKEHSEAGAVEALTYPERALMRFRYITYLCNRHRDANKLVDAEILYENYIRLFPLQEIK